jgi:hypothetical protein
VSFADIVLYGSIALLALALRKAIRLRTSEFEDLRRNIRGREAMRRQMRGARR